MTLLHLDGFDAYATDSDMLFEYGGRPRFWPGMGRFGGGALEASQNHALKYFGGSVYPDLWTGFALGIIDGGVAAYTTQFLCICTGTGQDELVFYYDSINGAINVYLGYSTTFTTAATHWNPPIATANVVIAKGAFGWIDVRAKFGNASNGILEVWLNGVRVINLTAATTVFFNTTQGGWTGVRFGSNKETSVLSGGTGRYIDDAYILSTSDGTGRLGDCKVLTVVPNSDAGPNVGTDPFNQLVTWNPNDKGSNNVLSNGNLDMNGQNGSPGNNSFVRAYGPARSSGKYVWELQLTSVTGGGVQYFIGAASLASSLTSSTAADTFYMYIYDSTNCVGNGMSVNSSNSVGVLANVANDKFMIAVDLDAGKAWLNKNGVWKSGDPAAGTTPWITWAGGTKALVPAVGSYSANSGVMHWNVTPTLTIPTGFSAWAPPVSPHASRVAEVSPNVTDYITLDASTANNKEMFGNTAISTTQTIFGVKVSAYAAKSDAADAIFAAVLKSGATEVAGTAVGAMIGANTKSSLLAETDPNTSAAWTQTGVNALNVGAKTLVP